MNRQTEVTMVMFFCFSVCLFDCSFVRLFVCLSLAMRRPYYVAGGGGFRPKMNLKEQTTAQTITIPSVNFSSAADGGPPLLWHGAQ